VAGVDARLAFDGNFRLAASMYRQPSPLKFAVGRAVSRSRQVFVKRLMNGGRDHAGAGHLDQQLKYGYYDPAAC